MAVCVHPAHWHPCCLDQHELTVHTQIEDSTPHYQPWNAVEPHSGCAQRYAGHHAGPAAYNEHPLDCADQAATRADQAANCVDQAATRADQAASHADQAAAHIDQAAAHTGHAGHAGRAELQGSAAVAVHGVQEQNMLTKSGAGYHALAGVASIPAERDCHHMKACWALPQLACLDELHGTVVAAWCHLANLDREGYTVMHDMVAGQQARRDAASLQTAVGGSDNHQNDCDVVTSSYYLKH